MERSVEGIVWNWREILKRRQKGVLEVISRLYEGLLKGMKENQRINTHLLRLNPKPLTVAIPGSTGEGKGQWPASEGLYNPY